MICHDCNKITIESIETFYGHAVCTQCHEEYYVCVDCNDSFYVEDFGEENKCNLCEEDHNE